MPFANYASGEDHWAAPSLYNKEQGGPVGFVVT